MPGCSEILNDKASLHLLWLVVPCNTSSFNLVRELHPSSVVGLLSIAQFTLLPLIVRDSLSNPGQTSFKWVFVLNDNPT